MASAEQNLAWTIASASKLVQTPLPTPTPGPKQVLIRITAASLNFRDHLIVHHSPAYPLSHVPNLIPCSDGAGTVVAAGESSVWRDRTGTHVAVHPNTWLDGDVGDGYRLDTTMGGGKVHGTLARFVVLDDERVLEAPKGLSDVESAALITAGSTAFNALFEGPGGIGKPAAGVTVLTQGTGGVSCFAIQLASAAGATVIATSSTDEKLETAKRLGAKHVINYRKNANWADEVLRITNGRGVDHVVEVGGAGTIEESLRSTRVGGLVSVMGILTESKQADLIPHILFGAKTIRGILGGGSKAINDRFLRFVEEHQIRPALGKEFGFEQAPEAFAQLEKQSEIGKIVITV
ncbi:nad-p-binding protein [Neofusicoccum parvum]|uniref:Nad-p-binding protein n=2 Tax=Neofusicoccum parvum TaxID=310453 RepID=A0ACB5RPY6_9PEZI|nr:putative alcohol dehydrogenase protein [Neofusicoccum parvum UCRNP2]GME22544.1 nad-p-binding protein [Neofusicoccum parvum]GME46826.1 nad-p-binding protein [Neofusicoccum parvum]